MRLLIVDDEYYTRRGISEDIDLRRIGIDETAEADDGVNALQTAAAFRPDIVLADVRMPRMDGVAMAFELRKLLPDCRIIFMSGYADKEYLKAAIELGAVSYIEKPFRSSELREALGNAVNLRRADEQRLRTEAELRARANAGDPFLRSEAALMLIESPPDAGRIEAVLDALGLSVLRNAPLIVGLAGPAGSGFPAESSFRKRFLDAVEREMTRASVGGLAAFMGQEQVLMVLFPARGRLRPVGEKDLGALLGNLIAAVPDVAMIGGVGCVVTGVSNARASFQAAVSSLEAAFFTGAGHIGFFPAATDAGIPADEKSLDELHACLDREDGTAARELLLALCGRLRESGSRDAGGAKDFFIRFFLRLMTFAEKRGIDALEKDQSVRTLSEAIQRCGTLDGIASILEARILFIFDHLSKRREEGGLVDAIKRCVHRNFASPGLGIHEIAAEARLSEAYACRMFKEATGQTIHHYLIAYRLERAKEVLSDRKLPKITEVAARVGFSDANYFARVFRKATGLIPSEYRERVIS